MQEAERDEDPFVVSFRHWVDYLPSRYAQNCMRRDSQTFDEYLAALQSCEGHPDLRFDLVLDRMLATGASVRAENYFKAEITIGRVGAEQTPPKREF